MADTKVSDFTALTGAGTATGDLFPIIDVSASGATKNKSITRAELILMINSLVSAAVANLTGTTLPAAVVNSSLTTLGVVQSLQADSAGVKINGLTSGSFTILVPAIVGGNYSVVITGGSSGAVLTIPSGNFSVARIDAAQTFVGVQTFSGGAITIAAASIGYNGSLNVGTLVVAGAISTDASLIANNIVHISSSTGYLFLCSNSIFKSPTAGIVSVTNAAETSFTSLALGPATTSFGKFVTGAAGLLTWTLGDGSGAAPLAAASISTSATDFLHKTTGTLAAGATGNAPTLTAGPVTGAPTKWIAISDNGTTRYIPAW